MRIKDPYDLGYGHVWNDVFVKYKEGYRTSVTDYHAHGFYEINLILSGNVKILMKDRFEEGNGKYLVLTRPGTPHYISCKPDTLYRRLYLIFTEDFIKDLFIEDPDIKSIFGDFGAIIKISDENAELFRKTIEQIRVEELREQRFLTHYFLSKVESTCERNARSHTKTPEYVINALSYIESHYGEKITAEGLAKALYIGRTTLMTEFKKHTGKTLVDYLTAYRIKNAILLLKEDRTLEYTAEKCGFSDSSGLIRAFKRSFGTTPHKYIKNSSD